MFIHGSLGHIAGNMLYLFIFGPAVEERTGPAHYLSFYLLSGIASGAATVAVVFMLATPSEAARHADGAHAHRSHVAVAVRRGDRVAHLRRFRREAEIVAMRSLTRGSIVVIPRIVLTTIGKNEMTIAMEPALAKKYTIADNPSKTGRLPTK